MVFACAEFSKAPTQTRHQRKEKARDHQPGDGKEWNKSADYARARQIGFPDNEAERFPCRCSRNLKRNFILFLIGSPGVTSAGQSLFAAKPVESNAIQEAKGDEIQS